MATSRAASDQGSLGLTSRSYSVVRTYRAIVDLEGYTAAVPERMLAAMAAAGRPDEVGEQLDALRGRYDRLLCYPPSHGLDEAEIVERLHAVIDTDGIAAP